MTVDVVELVDGSCQLVIEGPGLAVVAELDADEAIRVAGFLLDGGHALPLEEAS